jgi:hypothetical protein
VNRLLELRGMVETLMRSRTIAIRKSPAAVSIGQYPVAAEELREIAAFCESWATELEAAADTDPAPPDPFLGAL